MKPGKTEKYINKKIRSDGAILSVIIDPVDWPSPDAAVTAGKQAYEAGADIVAVGGSIGAQGELLDVVTREIKESVDVPVVLFPGNIATITRFADAIYFMSLLNSRNPYWISQAQTLAAPILHRIGLEPLPVGYIVVEPGGTVGWVGDANLVPRHKPSIAAALALAGEYSGNRVIFTDAGSASKDGPIPLPIVKAVSKAVSVPYLVAGGIRNSQEAAKIIGAGADWVQIGTAAEKSGDAQKTIQGFVKAIKTEGKKRV
jgi:phosphoglycerol geranylgeranyltransferase